jgi:hypothetical protein
VSGSEPAGTVSGPSTRRELTVAVLALALGGALALSSSSQPWVDVTIVRQPPLPPTAEVLTGGQAAPLVSACGLLLLAAAVAVIAVRGLGRVVVGLLVAVAGGVLGWSGLRGVTGQLDLDLTDVTSSVGLGRVVVGLLVAVAGGVLGWSGLRGVTGQLDLDLTDVTSSVGLGRAEVTGDPVAGWPALALIAGVLGVLAGLLVVLRGRRWPGMGRRYERTGTAAGQDPGRPGDPPRRARPETDEDRHQAAWKALDRGDDPTE